MAEAIPAYGNMRLGQLRRRVASGDAGAVAYEQEFARDLARIVKSALPDVRGYGVGRVLAEHSAARAREAIDAINNENLSSITSAIDSVSRSAAAGHTHTTAPREPLSVAMPTIEMPKFDMEEISAAHRAKEERADEMRSYLARLAVAAEEMRRDVAAAREAQHMAEVRADAAEAREASERVRQEAGTREAEKSARRWRWLTLAVGCRQHAGHRAPDRPALGVPARLRRALPHTLAGRARGEQPG